jgi:hypothetical protein
MKTLKYFLMGMMLFAVTAEAKPKGNLHIRTPGNPSNVAVQDLGNGQVKVTWVDNTANETSFQVNRYTVGCYQDPDNSNYDCFGSQQFTLAENSTEFTDSGLPDGAQVYYIVLACDSTGCLDGDQSQIFEAPKGNYSVSGHIVDSDYQSLQDVVVSLNGFVTPSTYGQFGSIPNVGTSQTFQINVTEDFNSTRIQVPTYFAIDSYYDTCEIVVRLTHPDGTSAIIYDSGNTSYIYHTVTLDSDTSGSPLMAFVGKSSLGTWTLSYEITGNIGSSYYNRTYLGAIYLSRAPLNSLTATSNANGIYTFASVPFGVYSISANKTGYNFYSRNLDIRKNLSRQHFLAY